MERSDLEFGRKIWNLKRRKQPNSKSHLSAEGCLRLTPWQQWCLNQTPRSGQTALVFNGIWHKFWNLCALIWTERGVKVINQFISIYIVVYSLLALHMGATIWWSTLKRTAVMITEARVAWRKLKLFKSKDKIYFFRVEIVSNSFLLWARERLVAV